MLLDVCVVKTLHKVKSTKSLYDIVKLKQLYLTLINKIINFTMSLWDMFNIKITCTCECISEILEERVENLEKIVSYI